MGHCTNTSHSAIPRIIIEQPNLISVGCDICHRHWNRTTWYVKVLARRSYLETCLGLKSFLYVLYEVSLEWYLFCLNACVNHVHQPDESSSSVFQEMPDWSLVDVHYYWNRILTTPWLQQCNHFLWFSIHTLS